jgi:hypothetical protein
MIETNIARTKCEHGTVSSTVTYTQMLAENRARSWLRVAVLGSGAVYVRIGDNTDGNPGAYVTAASPLQIEGRCSGSVNVVGAVAGDITVNAVEGTG